MPQLSRATGPIYYRDSGQEGPALLLLHEYFGTGESWSAQRLWFARHYRVIVPDLRGHGRSVINDDRSRLRVLDIARDMTALLGELRIEQVHVIGCSLGAVCGLYLAMKEPDSVASLALASIPNVHDSEARAYAQNYIERVFPRQERTMDRIHGDSDPGYARRLLLRNFALDLEERPADHVAAVSSIGEIVQPVLVIAGERDRVFPPRRALETAEQIEHSSLAILPETGHFPHQEMPGVFNEVVIDHLFRNTHGS